MSPFLQHCCQRKLLLHDLHFNFGGQTAEDDIFSLRDIINGILSTHVCSQKTQLNEVLLLAQGRRNSKEVK